VLPGGPERRDVRRGMGRISASTAQALLREYAAFLRWLADRLPGESDDLLQIGRVAVMEAYLSWDATQQASRRTWTRKVARWRMAEAAQRITSQSADASPDQSLVDSAPNGLDPEGAYLRAFARESIGLLSHHQRNVLDAWLRGYTFREIGSQIGVSDTMAHRLKVQAIARLQRWADDDVE